MFLNDLLTRSPYSWLQGWFVALNRFSWESYAYQHVKSISLWFGKQTTVFMQCLRSLKLRTHYQQQLGSHGILAGSCLRSLKMLLWCSQLTTLGLPAAGMLQQLVSWEFAAIFIYSIIQASGTKSNRWGWTSGQRTQGNSGPGDVYDYWNYIMRTMV
jgi:hypothetical protein